MRIAMAEIESAASKDSDATPSACAARVEREATRRGFDQVSRRAVLGAGAPWIWNLAAEHFPGAVQIVDRFHAKPHLSDVGDLDAVLEALRTHAATHDDAGKCVDYVERNRERMRYPEFRASGAVCLDGRGRGRLQGGHRDPLQAGRHALDGGRRRRHHRAAMLHAERALRGLLGAAIGRPGGGRMSLSHNPDVHPPRQATLKTLVRKCYK